MSRDAGEQREQGRETYLANVPQGTPVTVRIGQHGGGWFKMFRSLVRSGAWARLSSPAHAVYPVLAERCDPQWQVQASYREIADRSGLSMRSVQRGIHDLIAARLVIRQADPQGHDGGRYVLIPSAERVDKNGTPGWTKNVPQGGQGCLPRVDKNGTFEGPNLSTLQNIEHARGFRDSFLRQQQQQSVLPGKREETAAAVRCALVEAGIGEPVLGELCALPGVSPELVRELVAGLRPGKGTGVLIAQIRVAAEAAVRRRQRRERDRQNQAAAQAERARQRDQGDRERQVDAALLAELAGMPEADRAELVRETLAALPPAARKLAGRNPDPLTNAVLRLHVRRHRASKAGTP